MPTAAGATISRISDFFLKSATGSLEKQNAFHGVNSCTMICVPGLAFDTFMLLKRSFPVLFSQFLLHRLHQLYETNRLPQPKSLPFLQSRMCNVFLYLNCRKCWGGWNQFLVVYVIHISTSHAFRPIPFCIVLTQHTIQVGYPSRSHHNSLVLTYERLFLHKILIGRGGGVHVGPVRAKILESNFGPFAGYSCFGDRFRPSGHSLQT